MITVSAYRWVPEFAQGLVKDLRVRWALEEAGLPYREHLLEAGEKDAAAYRALQPFGQVPALRTEGLSLFESGAIVLHIAQQCEALMPHDAAGRARTTSWVFAALNSIEPAVDALGDTEGDEAWAVARRPAALAKVQMRLDQLQAWLGDKDYLEGRFTAGDLMMTTVLRNLRQTDIVADRPRLSAYVARCQARPAFGTALADHMRPFEATAA
ncbi:glutathione S-transferase family protein [Phenylobacterium sp.]|uniref:glutathione S-transferase family protein n=1 Tax=Phenylobacterium sp. TaxID=1871053 RepID=UPI002CDA9702|nr:glutathione S-transferase family protein [Phenylobacterium sp.]HLZ75980.1 glutathione S-transferase family protein [Phenylobacterium sp.]